MTIADYGDYIAAEIQRRPCIPTDSEIGGPCSHWLISELAAILGAQTVVIKGDILSAFIDPFQHQRRCIGSREVRWQGKGIACMRPRPNKRDGLLTPNGGYGSWSKTVSEESTSLHLLMVAFLNGTQGPSW